MDSLYVITAIFNPCLYKTRYKLYYEFEKRCNDANMLLYTVEAAFKKQPFQVTNSKNKKHIQVRTDHELWLKENLLNIAIDRLPKTAKYIAWIDADVIFTNPNIVEDTIKSLKKYDVVQMFSHCMDLDPTYSCLYTKDNTIKLPQQSSCYRYVQNGFKHLITRDELNSEIGHTGYAWAATKEALQYTKGLLDFAILGSADKYMLHAWVGRIEGSINQQLFSDEYNQAIKNWSDQATNINKNVGYVNGLLLHYFHGTKKNRGYGNRGKILQKHKFDPLVDIKKSKNNVIMFSGNKPLLENVIYDYFKSRKEDSAEI
jgi:hypothetical protein